MSSDAEEGLEPRRADYDSGRLGSREPKTGPGGPGRGYEASLLPHAYQRSSWPHLLTPLVEPWRARLRRPGLEVLADLGRFPVRGHDLNGLRRRRRRAVLDHGAGVVGSMPRDMS